MLRMLLDVLAFYWVAEFSFLKNQGAKPTECHVRKLRILIRTIQWWNWEAGGIWLLVACRQVFPGPCHSFPRLWVGGVLLGCLFYESSGSHCFQLSSSLLIFINQGVNISVYFSTGCEGEEVKKIMTRIPARGSLDFERNTCIFRLETKYNPKSMFKPHKVLRKQLWLRKEEPFVLFQRKREKEGRIKREKEVEVVERKSGAGGKVIEDSVLCDVTQVFKWKLTEFQSAWWMDCVWVFS